MTNAPSATKKIVCAIDFSLASGHALKWAASAAQRWGVALDVISVVSMPDDLMVDVARQRLDDVVASLVTTRGLRVTGQVLVGQAHEQIAAHAERTQAFLIVLGARSRSAAGRWLLGSVADRTLRLVQQPVVFVPGDGAEVDDTGAAPPPPTEQPMRVMVGIDTGPSSDAALAFVRQLRATTACDVTFLHLYWPVEQYERLGLRGRRVFEAVDPEVVANLEPELHRRIGVLPGQGQMRLWVRSAWGSPATNLEIAAGEELFDLLVVGAETRRGWQRVWHPSAATSLVHHLANLPVVCVPATFVSQAPPEIPRLLTVLAPTDFSPLANAAIVHAYSLVRHHGGVVELCHVRPHHLPSPGFAYDNPTPTLTPAERAKLEAELRALIPASAVEYGISTHVSVIDGGDVATAIVQAAERLRADAISLASHGVTGLRATIAGSVARAVLERARTPVMVVRPDCGGGRPPSA